jgi:hypothetical protein
VITEERRSDGLEARELCKGLSKLSVADDNKSKVKRISLLKKEIFENDFYLDFL